MHHGVEGKKAHEDGTGGRWIRGAACCLALFVAVSSAPANADDDDRGRAWEASLRLEEGYTDNVRWAEDGPEKDGAFFTTISGQLDLQQERFRVLPDRAQAGVRGRLYDRFSKRDFVEVYSRLAYEIGRTNVLLRYSYIPRHLRLEDDINGGDVYSANQELAVGLERKLGKRRRLRIRALFENEWDNTRESFDERDSYTPAGSLDLRYRVHDLFTPRVGVRYGVRDAKSENYDRDEIDVEAGFDTRPLDSLRLAFRYKRLMRDYTVDSPTTDTGGRNSNFDREDDADQFEVFVDFSIPRIDGLALAARYKIRDNASTRDSREFDVQEAGVGLSYTFR